MKSFIYLLIAFLSMVCVPAYAADPLTFSWLLPDPAEEITGYHLYMDCGSPECILVDIKDPLATTWSMEPPKEKHTFSLTAYRIEDDGSISESLQSAYANYEPPKKPKPKPIIRFEFLVK